MGTRRADWVLDCAVPEYISSMDANRKIISIFQQVNIVYANGKTEYIYLVIWEVQNGKENHSDSL